MPNILISLLLLLATPIGQAPTSTPNSDDYCGLQGVVVGAGAGEPLRKASVQLCATETSNQCSGATANAMGQFEIRGVSPGRYRLSATATGYIETPYGQRTPGGMGAILNLSRGEKLTGLSIKLIPAGVISGRVYDEDGLPLADVVVSDLTVVYTSGQRQLRASTVVRTNDLGEYRLWGLNPGQHFVLAEYKPTRPANFPPGAGYLPTFYPGGLDAVHATPISILGGDEFDGANIDLQPAHTVRVRGHIYGGGEHHTIFLILREISALGDLVPPVYAQEKDGEFQLNNVTPGSYYLYAIGRDQSGPKMSREPLEVGDADLENVDMTVQQSMSFSGNIRIEGMLRAPSMRVSLTPRGGQKVFGTAPSAYTDIGGRFTLDNVYPGDYDVQVDDIPPGCYLRSAATRGSDILANGFSPEHGGPIDISIGRYGASIYGAVTKDQQPYTGATVTLVPDPPRRSEPHLYKITSTDQSGHFILDGVAPGDYKVFAWESVEHAAYANSDFLQPFELQGESAHVSQGSRVTVNLTLIPKTDVE
jgi:hypothetical protein